MSNVLRNKVVMDYFKGMRDAIDTLNLVMRYYINGQLTESDYVHVLDLVRG